MATTTCRIYGLEPTDIQVRPAAHPESDVVVHLGDTVAIQGSPGQMKYLFRCIEERIGFHIAKQPPPIGDTVGEPF